MPNDVNHPMLVLSISGLIHASPLQIKSMFWVHAIQGSRVIMRPRAAFPFPQFDWTMPAGQSCDARIFSQPLEMSGLYLSISAGQLYIQV